MDVGGIICIFFFTYPCAYICGAYVRIVIGPQKYKKNPIYANIYGKIFNICWFCNKNDAVLIFVCRIEGVNMRTGNRAQKIGDKSAAKVQKISELCIFFCVYQKKVVPLHTILFNF